MILLHGGLNKAIQGVQCVGGTQEILMVMTVKVVRNWERTHGKRIQIC